MRNVWLIICFILWGVCPSLAQSADARLAGIDSAHPPPEVLHYSSRQLKVPAALINAGIALDLNAGVKNTQLKFHENHFSSFKTSMDSYLLYVPAVIPYGLDVLDIPSRTDIANRTAILLKGEILVGIAAFVLKHAIREWRPDKTNHYSFPSGHAMQAFATATLLNVEYGQRFHWVPYAAYGFATSIGVLRIANNKHYIGDVLMGAGLGILLMKVSYWTHQYKWNRQRR